MWCIMVLHPMCLTCVHLWLADASETQSALCEVSCVFTVAAGGLSGAIQCHSAHWYVATVLRLHCKLKDLLQIADSMGAFGHCGCRLGS